MQKPVKRGNAYRITVRHNGQRFTATRDTSAECEQWAAKKLLELQSQSASQQEEKIHISFYSLFDQYYHEHGKNMKSADFILQQLKALKSTWGADAEESIHDLTPAMVKRWRDQRLKTVKTSTVIRQMGVYSSAFEYARRELFLTKENPFKEVTKPSMPPPRHQRIHKEDEEVIIKALGYKRGQTPTLPRHFVAWAFLFALETTMRKGELLSIKQKHIFEDYIKLYDTKNGTNRDVPLTAQAQEMLTWLKPKDPDDRIFPHNSNSFRLVWQRHLAKTKYTGKLHFHDTRHEAITRFVHNYKIPVEILAKITGHKMISVLVNTYYNPTASEIAKMLKVA
ncbi:tyrosine-type recombinase/integrase [Acinetobacter rudis]|uniref:Site-specific integrase n=1 Tax=Acinetobacter rudis TaxID=632955 RepID=A0AAW8JDA1_9GAMM|nr:site-specific integrase [Acinetobacter rudis]MDQ8937169.1 site-specific integrase [Acinetobacter rudis]MDQ8953163.1 site-specific integrase [Acinetobacter rudis]MDQ9019370.1 site-specific integrase [Acinetobacter rudis]